MREIQNINKGWLFNQYPEKSNDFVSLDLPHTWNAEDGADGGNDYYRGRALYQKKLGEIVLQDDEELYLEFQGVGMSADVYLNGELLAHHDGGYSTFRVDLTKSLRGENELKVFVDNSINETVYPQTADFTFYGGIYRDVNLIKVKKEHFALMHWGGCGIKVTPLLCGEDAEINIEAWIENPKSGSATFSIGENAVSAPIKEGKAKAKILLKQAHLWNGFKDPYLYVLKAVVGEDETEVRFGVRSFGVDPERGFLLNGEEYPLIGVARHQDKQGKGNALSKEDHELDFAIIKEMGANTIRLAHYQHDPYVYELADRYGFILWAEIPYISRFMKDGHPNAESQLKELIIQNYNHPSIVTWGLSNEITVSGPANEALIESHQKLNALAHELDATRPTTMANLFLLESSSPLVSLPDIRSYNLYYGWYVGDVGDNGPWFDKFHKEHPTLAIGLSEYGADANPAYQSEEPQKGDYSETYQAYYHEKMMEMRLTRPYLWAMHVWNMFDFAADGRDEGGKKGINQKGLVTYDRKTKKDAFYLYKAYLSTEPFVHLCGKRYKERSAEMTHVKVYSNLPEVSLYVNGALFETKKGSKVFEFLVPLKGETIIEAVSSEEKDEMTIEKVEKENPAYSSPTKMKVINWFEIDQKKEGYFSLDDKVADIKAHPVAGAFYAKIMAEMTAKIGDVAKGFKMSPEMQAQMDQMSLKQTLQMAGHMVPPEAAKALAEALGKIKK